ncbi:MAG: hypothetical protein U0325_21750 [Polyangiales bacterium]
MNERPDVAQPPRAARLFRSLVVSSGLLLTGCGSTVVTSRATGPAASDDVPSGAPDAPAVPVDAPAAAPVDASVVAPLDAPVATPPDVQVIAADVPVVQDAMPLVDAQALVDAALADARSQEIGWPTTKGVFCWGNDAGVVACCRHVDSDDSPSRCCAAVPGGCAPCEPDDAGACVRTDAALWERP